MIATEPSRAVGSACLLAGAAALLVLGGCAQTRTGQRPIASATKTYRVGSVSQAMSTAAARDPEELARLQRRIQRGTAAAGARPERAGAAPQRRAAAAPNPRATRDAGRPSRPGAGTAIASVSGSIPASEASAPGRAGLESATLQRVEYARPARPSAAPATGPAQALQAVVAQGRARQAWLLAAAGLALLALLAGIVALFRRRRSDSAEADTDRYASLLTPANDAGAPATPRRSRSEPPPPLVTIRAAR